MEIKEQIKLEKETKNKEYKKSWWISKGKEKYKRITINFSDEEFKKIDTLSKKTKRKHSEVVKLACLNSLNDNQDKRVFNIDNKDDIEEKQKLIQETLQVFRNLGTNINQITRNINEKRLMNNFFNNEITKEEKQKILSSIEEIEKEFTKFIQNNI